MQVITHKSEVEQSIISFYLCEEVSIVINCICEPRMGSEANEEAFPGDLPGRDSPAEITSSATAPENHTSLLLPVLPGCQSGGSAARDAGSTGWAESRGVGMVSPWASAIYSSLYLK